MSEREQGSTHPEDEAADVPEQDDVTESTGTEPTGTEVEVIEKTEVIETVRDHDDTELIAAVDPDETAVIETTGPDATQVIETADPGETEVIETADDQAPTRRIDDTPATAAMPTTAFAATEPKPVTTPEEAPAPERVSVADPLSTPAAVPQPTWSAGSPPQSPPPGTPDATWTHSPMPAPAPRGTGPRAGTVIWGLIVVAVGAAILASTAGLHVDFQLAFIGLLAVAGVALLVSSLANAVRRRDRSSS